MGISEPQEFANATVTVIIQELQSPQPSFLQLVSELTLCGTDEKIPGMGEISQIRLESGANGRTSLKAIDFGLKKDMYLQGFHLKGRSADRFRERLTAFLIEQGKALGESVDRLKTTPSLEDITLTSSVHNTWRIV